MKIAIGLITTIFGVLVVMLGIITNAAYIVKGPSGMMMAFDPPRAYSIGAVLIIAGCVFFERGIKEK